MKCIIIIDHVRCPVNGQMKIIILNANMANITVLKYGTLHYLIC